ncbi:MAG TPA: DNA repair protein RadC, partial [Elusimicrobiales bacterium]|nr:DNA repair protein RadC [Elusimicrobiales bacterium]
MEDFGKPHYLGHRKRLRDRLIQLGLESLQEYELVELLLTYVLPHRDVKPIAKELLKKFGSIKGIFDANEEELKSVKYVKDKFVTLIKLLKELNYIYHKQIAMEKTVLDSIDKVAKYCIERIGHKKEEEFLVIYLDTSFKIQSEKAFPAKEFYFSGTLDRTTVYIRNIIEEGLKKKSYAIILVHNHPNGRVEPSEQDKNLTNKINIAAKSVEMILYDHI